MCCFCLVSLCWQLRVLICHHVSHFFMLTQVFSKQDCVYHAMRSIFKLLSEVKAQVKESSESAAAGRGAEGVVPEHLQHVIQNALDMLRLVNIAYPTEDEDKTEDIDASTFLLPPSSIDHSEENSDDEDGDSDSDSDDDRVKSSVPKKRARYAKKRTLLADESQRKKKKMVNLTSTEKLLEKACHVKEFSRTWLLLFSLPMSKQQRRLALKHLPAHVTPFLLHPVMLADYLVKTVRSGGVVGILALESLFQIIVLHNLDYPRFFEALYRMCSAEVFSAKHRSKFTTLLHTSLQSTNLPAYTVAAFIKRLAGLAIKIPGPSASFCLAQAVTLLRQHPQCLKLIHNTTDKAAVSEGRCVCVEALTSS
jgi:U3 small nucleolar RNA-associated protein 19